MMRTSLSARRVETSNDPFRFHPFHLQFGTTMSNALTSPYFFIGPRFGTLSKSNLLMISRKCFQPLIYRCLYRFILRREIVK